MTFWSFSGIRATTFLKADTLYLDHAARYALAISSFVLHKTTSGDCLISLANTQTVVQNTLRDELSAAGCEVPRCLLSVTVSLMRVSANSIYSPFHHLAVRDHVYTTVVNRGGRGSDIPSP